MSKFVVSLDGGSREQRNAVTEILQQQGWPVWHWMEDTWLLANIPPSVTAKRISEMLEANPIIGRKSSVIIRISDTAATQYWGWQKPEAWAWMKQYWGNAE